MTKGVRTIDNIKRFQKTPLGSSLTQEELEKTVFALESQIAENGRLSVEAGGRGIEKLPGVTELLRKLEAGGARYGIVTSATKYYADSALKTAAMPQFPFYITADVCTHGKPHPEPYLNGIEKLKQLAGPTFAPNDVLVFEDAPSGLASGLAAGCRTLAVCTGQTEERIRATPASYKVRDLSQVDVLSVVEGVITLRLHMLEELAN